MKRLAAIILAAGKGTRMKSSLPKVLHPIAGRHMIEWVVEAASATGADPVVIVIGSGGDRIRDLFANSTGVIFATQQEQLGTGHAVASAIGALGDFNGDILILCGDTPLLTPGTLKGLIASHRSSDSYATMLTAIVQNPHGYGRVIRDTAGKSILRIAEQKDATDDELRINEINSGIYCMKSDFVFDNIDSLRSDNAQKEYYLTDMIPLAASSGLTLHGVPCLDPDEIMGVNDRVQLAAASHMLRERINRSLMLSGVSMIDPERTYIDHGTFIGGDTVIYPGCSITGGSVIGKNCLIENGAIISASHIGNGCHIKSGSVMEGALLRDGVTVGPMAHLRPGTELMDDVKIGNFVETKKAVIGRGSKASHLTYLGDAEIGAEVNIGCGTITCNYDGISKHCTVIEDRVFIGSDVQLVAPVKVGANSLVAAGTTVTEDIPPDSLAIARVPQLNKVGWRLKKR